MLVVFMTSMQQRTKRTPKVVKKRRPRTKKTTLMVISLHKVIVVDRGE